MTNNEEHEIWKREQEYILKEWSDKAQCYYWMHLKSHRKYKLKNTYFTIPVIIISTLTGTATFANNLFGNYQQIASICIGSMNILAGIITTIFQFLKIAELNESHKAAALSWEKFHEYIKVELLKNPVDRETPSKVLKYCSQQYDHLIEFSPIIPEDVITTFKSTFKKKFKDISVPTICGRLKTTRVFDETIANMLVFKPPVREESSSESNNTPISLKPKAKKIFSLETELSTSSESIENGKISLV